MLGRLLVPLICVPLIDLYVLIRLGDLLGFWPTVAIVVITGFTGAWLLRWQGLRTLGRIQSQMANGKLPATELLDGTMILFAAALLLTPGFLTDLLGLLLLVPFVRSLFRSTISNSISRNIKWTTVHYAATSSEESSVRPSDPIIFSTGADSPRMKYVRNLATDESNTTVESEAKREEGEPR